MKANKLGAFTCVVGIAALAGAANAYDLVVDTASGSVTINEPQSYTEGVLVRGAPHNAKIGNSYPVSPVLAVGAAGTLGANDPANGVTVEGGVLKLADPANLGAAQPLSVFSTGHSLGVLALGSAFSGVPPLTADGAAVLALDGVTGSFGITNQSQLGSGRWFIGAASASTFNPDSLAPGLDNRYRFGGGGNVNNNAGVLQLKVALTDVGGTDLEIGSLQANGHTAVQARYPVECAGDAVINRTTFDIVVNAKPTAIGTWYVNDGGRLVKSWEGDWQQDDGVTTFGRIGNAASVILNCGEFNIRADQYAASAERLGAVKLDTGRNVLVSQSWGAGFMTLHLAALERGAGRGTAAVTLYGDIHVADAGSVPLIGGDGLRITNKPIVPFLVGSPVTHLVTFTATDGLLLFEDTDYVASLADAHADGNDNVNMDMGTVTDYTLTADVAVNSLLVGDGGNNRTMKILDGGEGGHTLTVKSGVMAMSWNHDSRLEIYPAVSFGDAEAVLRAYGNYGILFHGSLIGTNGLTVMSGLVQLTGDNSAFSGPITVQGTLIPGTVNALPPTASVYLQGGALAFGIWETGSQWLSCATLRGAGTIQQGNDLCALNIGANTGGARGWVTLNTGGTLWPGQFPAAALDSDLRVGTIVIDQFQTGDNKAAKLALKDGTLRMTLAAPGAHSMITFSTSRSNGYAVLAFGDPGSTLEIDLGYLPQAGDLFKIIDVFGTNQSTGSFANGDTVDATFNGRVVTFDILYNSDLGGGDGNDVVLRMRPIPPIGTTILIR